MLEIWFRFKELIILFIFILFGIVFSVIFNWGALTIFIVLYFFIGYIRIIGQLQKTNESDKRTMGQNSFKFGKYLTVISYHLIKADDTISDNEKKLMENRFADEFSKARAKFYIKNINVYTNKISLKKASINLTKGLKGSSKVQLLHYLITLITSDRFLSVNEVRVLRRICKYSQIHYNTLDAVLAMFNYTSEEDLNKKAYIKKYTSNSITKHYKILELNELATADEIKTAYRRLVKIYHPDKQIGNKKLNLTFAKQKFQAIQEAYEKLKKYKNFN